MTQPTGFSPRVVRGVLLANLVAQVGIVVTGGLVRLTGSGLGCPTWPECVPGSYVPIVRQPQGYHKDIEFTNRMLTFLVGLAAVAALVVMVRAFRSGAAGRGLLALGCVPLLGVVAQAMLGGFTVLTGLSPATVAAHLLLSMSLIAASTVLFLHAPGGPRPGGPPVHRDVRRLGWAVAAVGAVVIGLGTVVTGSGPHSGDAHAPARFGIDPRSAAWVHADAVWLFVGLVVALVVALRVTGASPVARQRSVILLGVTLAQGVIGYAQYFTGLPVPLVALHLLGASLLVIAITATVDAMATPAGDNRRALTPIAVSEPR